MIIWQDKVTSCLCLVCKQKVVNGFEEDLRNFHLCWYPFFLCVLESRVLKKSCMNSKYILAHIHVSFIFADKGSPRIYCGNLYVSGCSSLFR